MYRSHTCGELNKKLVDKSVTLCGWVEKVRAHGKVGFIDMKDRYGEIQLFFKGKLVEDISNLRRESIIKIKGKVQKRLKANKDIENGDIEIHVSSFELLNEAKPLPLELDDPETSEETRLKYRYLDLKTKKMQKNLELRHKVNKAIRDFLDKEGFLEIETPILAKSTPEGARDYLVPSRLYKGKFYALPQSPQLFKQLLMIAGYDKYFQIVRCFRDEDTRADRQPEFTQLDMEMSFVDEENVYSLMEGLMKFIWKEVLDVDIKLPFERMSYEEAIKKHKTDKPDLRKKGEKYKFLWVTDFPLLEWNEDEKRYYAMHHPFTSPKEEDKKLLDKSPEKVRAKAYDLVLNGVELGGGSIRIHQKELQDQMFSALGISPDEADDKFGFFLNALEFAPPHGGIAFGLDRMIMLMAEEESIREVIAFPKSKEAKDLMLDSPSEVSKEQLKELGLNIKK